jgi:NAD-dependent dihydropyrimidine dehydrogenase PreA subunit
MSEKIQVDYDKCCWKDGKCVSCGCGGACEGCVEICPVGAVSREDKVVIDQAACIACGSCVAVCKHKALSMC